MFEITPITPEFAIGPQPAAEDFAAVRKAGFAAVLNVRPDDENDDYLVSTDARSLAEDQGLTYAHSPSDNHALFETDIIDRFERALTELPKPIFAHCKSGTRTAILWALVASRHRDAEEVIADLRDAGQDIEFLEDELRESANKVRSSPLRLKDDALLSLGRSRLLGGRQRD